MHQDYLVAMQRRKIDFIIGSDGNMRIKDALVYDAGGKKIVEKLSESQIQQMIMQYLRYKGWFVVKIHQSLGSYKGIADLYALKDGRNVWIEVKTPRGKLSKYQEQFRKDIVAHGGEYMVARSVDDVKILDRAVTA